MTAPKRRQTGCDCNPLWRAAVLQYFGRYRRNWICVRINQIKAQLLAHQLPCLPRRALTRPLKTHLRTKAWRRTPHTGSQPIIMIPTGLSKASLSVPWREKKKHNITKQRRAAPTRSHLIPPAQSADAVLHYLRQATTRRRRSIPAVVGRGRRRLPLPALTHYGILPVFAHQRTREQRGWRRRALRKTLAALV